MNIMIDDVKWTKHGTYSIIDNEEEENDTMCVVGTIDGVQIGHYLTGRDDNSVCCVVIFKEEDGNDLFINRTYVINDQNNNDQFFRERIVKTYNNYSKIKSILD